jgi:hypothetical protein
MSLTAPGPPLMTWTRHRCPSWCQNIGSPKPFPSYLWKRSPVHSQKKSKNTLSAWRCLEIPRSVCVLFLDAIICSSSNLNKTVLFRSRELSFLFLKLRIKLFILHSYDPKAIHIYPSYEVFTEIFQFEEAWRVRTAHIYVKMW